MSDFKREIKAWLKRIGRDRTWLALQIKRSKSTLDEWLSEGGTISAAYECLIKKLMQETDDSLIFDHHIRNYLAPFVVMVNVEEYNQIANAAHNEQMHVSEWAARELICRAREILDRKVIDMPAGEPYVAEGDAGYCNGTDKAKEDAKPKRGRKPKK